MKTTVRRLYNHGRLIGADESSAIDELQLIDGDLSLFECYLAPWRRPTRKASLTNPVSRGHLLPVLQDAVVLTLEDQEMVLAGAELDPETGQSVTQAWAATVPPGLVTVTLLYDDGGRRLPRHRLGTLPAPAIGDLKITIGHDKDYQRTLRLAQLLSGSGEAIIPSLRDAVVLWIGESSLTVTGMAEEAFSRKTMGQSWFVSYGAV